MGKGRGRTSALGLHISTWSYENWVSKHFVISLNFPCLYSFFTELFACVLFLFVLWVDICVEVAVDRISRISIYPPTPLHFLPFFWILPTILYSTQVTVI